MRRNLWIRAVWVAAAGAVAAGPPAPATAAAPPGDLTAALRTTLLAQDTPPAAREAAARRLVAGRSPADVAALRDGLASGSAAVQVAVARTLSETADPDPGLLFPVATLLGPERTTEAAASALAAYAGTASVGDAVNALQRYIGDPMVGPVARAPAVRALGAFAPKAVAQYLVTIATTWPNVTLQRAAARALADLSGEADRGPAAWGAWWAAHANQSEDAWRAYLLGVRLHDDVPARARMAQLVDASTQLLRENYYRLPDPAKLPTLTAYLSSRSPVIRTLGAALVGEQLQSPVIGEPVLAAVRDLVSDEDPGVRTAAIATLQAAVDQLAGPAMIAQLRRETDPAIKRALILALGKAQVVDAEPALEAMLNDARPDVATVAARVLGEPPAGMGRQIKARAPDLARRAAIALQRVIANPRPGPPPTSAADDVRAACVGALPAVSDVSPFELLRGLLNAQPPESSDVRVAALTAFGALGDRNANAIVAAALADPDRRVRLAAARAMRTVARVEDASELGAMLKPDREPDPSVRDAAWLALAALLDKGDVNFVKGWVDQFADDPDRRLAVQLDYARALAAAGPADGTWAANEQEIAQTFMDLNRSPEAVGHLQAAIDYYQRSQPAGGESSDRLINLVGQMLDARLKSRQYAAAVDFAGQQLKRPGGFDEYERLVGRKFCDGADQLRAANDAADANALIDAALSMQPPLEERFATALRQTREQLLAPAGRP